MRSPQYRSSPRNLKSPQPLAIWYGKKISPPLPPQKKYLWVGGVYTMENKDTNTKYEKLVRVGDQKWEILEITIGIFFFIICLRWFVFAIVYTGSFQVQPEKNHPHLKCQFPPRILIWPKSLLYKHSEKWLPLKSGLNLAMGQPSSRWKLN